jgi:hypothetical protein
MVVWQGRAGDRSPYADFWQGRLRAAAGAGPPLRKTRQSVSIGSLFLMQGERFGGGSGVVQDMAGEDAEVEGADGGDA